eukprot:COSAG03_NODE_287_length_9368_cov_412.210594_2_plen_934_part_00
MPQLPEWAPAADYAAQLSVAAEALLATPPALQRVTTGSAVDAARTAELREQYAARWRPHLQTLVAAAERPRGRLALRLVDGVLGALSDTVRWRRRGDTLRLEVLRVLHTVCAADVDAVADLGWAGFHAHIAGYAAASVTAPGANSAEQADDELVAEIMSVIVASGCPFNSRRGSDERRPAPLRFAASGEAGGEATLALRQVPKPVDVHYDVGFLLWPNAILLSRFMCGNFGDGVDVRRTLLPNARVLELGAGVGMVGLALARCACDDKGMCAAPAEVILTDHNLQVLQNLRYNISLNSPMSDDEARHAPIVRAGKLDFTAATAAAVLSRDSAVVDSERQGGGWDGENGVHEAAADVVVGADIIASAEDARSVVGVLQLTLAKPHGVAFLALPHSDSRYGIDVLNGYLDQVEELHYEMAPYERLAAGTRCGHGEDSSMTASEAAGGLFAGLEPERDSGMRWLHYRIWWRGAKQRSGATGVPSEERGSDPLHQLDEAELRTLLAATGWNSRLLAKGAGCKQMVALLRGCMRACSHDSSSVSSQSEVGVVVDTHLLDATAAAEQPKGQSETASSNTVADELPDRSSSLSSNVTAHVVHKLYSSAAADIEALTDRTTSEMVRRATHEVKLQEQVAARKAARARKMLAKSTSEPEPEPELELQSYGRVGANSSSSSSCSSDLMNAVGDAAAATDADDTHVDLAAESCSSSSSGGVDALFDNLEDALCDHLGEEYDDKEQAQQIDRTQPGAADRMREAGGVEQWLYPDPWQRLHELGFGPYRELLSEYGMISADKMRLLGCNGLEQQLQELQVPDSDIDRMLAAVFAKKISSATGSYTARRPPLFVRSSVWHPIGRTVLPFVEFWFTLNDAISPCFSVWLLGGIYDQEFLAAVQPLYDLHMGVENMGPLLYSLIRFHKPRHVLEVGAGYFTAPTFQPVS